MGTVITKEFWTVEQIFKFVDERLDKHAFYAWGMEEGASKKEVIDALIEDAVGRGSNKTVIKCVFNGYPLPNIVFCRARLDPYDEGFDENIGEDAWVFCSGQLVLGTLYAFREGLTERAKAWTDEENPSWWECESYKTLCDKASMGDKEAKERFEAFNSCEIPVIRILEMDNRNMDDIGDINEILDCYAD